MILQRTPYRLLNLGLSLLMALTFLGFPASGVLCSRSGEAQGCSCNGGCCGQASVPADTPCVSPACCCVLMSMDADGRPESVQEKISSAEKSRTADVSVLLSRVPTHNGANPHLRKTASVPRSILYPDIPLLTSSLLI
jgi:hypothetical protein